MMKLNRREFLGTVGKGVVVLVAPSIIIPEYASAAEDDRAFVLNTGKIPAGSIYEGTRTLISRNPQFVSKGEVIPTTSAYEPIASGEYEIGTGGYEIAIVKANSEADRKIKGYYRAQQSVDPITIFLEREDVVAEWFKALPNDYEGSVENNLAQVISDLDATSKVIEYS